MSRAVILTVLLATLIVVGTSTPVWAAQLDARINPNAETSPFSMHYLRTVFIEYQDGGDQVVLQFDNYIGLGYNNAVGYFLDVLGIKWEEV